MKKIGICCLGLLFSLCSYAQVQREYHLISAEKIENKAYYFTALLREFGEVDSMICHDPVLKKMASIFIILCCLPFRKNDLHSHQDCQKDQ